MSRRGRDKRAPAARAHGAEITDVVSQMEVTAAKPAFLAAVTAAKEQLAQEQSRRATEAAARGAHRTAGRANAGHRWLAGALIGLLIVALTAVLLLAPLGRIEAEPFQGFQGLVVSSYSLQPVPGVEVHRVLPQATELVARTDAEGMFNIQAASNVASSDYMLLFQGRRIGEFHTGREERLVRGYDQFIVDVKLERSSREQAVHLEPGAAITPSPTIRLELDASATQAWDGTITEDMQWPAYFLFAQVLGGIYELQGPADPGLRLSVFISAADLQLFETQARQVRLIARDERYLRQEENGKGTTWRAYHHHGWYATSFPEYAFLPRIDPGIEEVTSGPGGRAGAWVTWNPQPRTPYALLAPPPVEGYATACWIDWLAENGTQTKVPAVRLQGRTRAQPLLYDVLYYSSDYDEYFSYQNFPSKPARECYFWPGDEPRGYFREDVAPPLAAWFEQGDARGQFWIKLMDFTLAQPRVFGPVTYKTQAKPGSYDISFELGGLGEVTTMRLTGDLDKLAQPPQWDLYSDNVTDAYGYEAEITIQHPGSYRVRAIVTETSGNVIYVERSIPCAPPGILGYETWSPGDVPVLEGRTTCPMQNASVRQVSLNGVSSPAAYGYTATNVAGAALFIDPPPQFQETPLKELRVTLFARATGGDATEMALRPEVIAGVRSGNLVKPFTVSDNFSYENGSLYPINSAAHSFHVQVALNLAEDPQAQQTPEAYLQRQYAEGHGETWFKMVTGIDVQHLPSRPELLRQLREFRNSRYFGQKFASTEITEINWVDKLWGRKLPAGTGLKLHVVFDDYNLLYAGQWEFYSGTSYPSRVELENEDGEILWVYYDFSPLAWTAQHREAGQPASGKQ